MNLFFKTRLEHLKMMPPSTLVVYAVSTPWWNVPDYTGVWYKTPGEISLPCDPRGSMLMEGELKKFIDTAEQNADHYGSHGMLTFMAAFHGNVTIDGKPTSLDNWKAYNDLITAFGSGL